jgi:hypothetical protein
LLPSLLQFGITTVFTYSGPNCRYIFFTGSLHIVMSVNVLVEMLGAVSN